jgi:Base plate wedge protein 53
MKYFQTFPRTVYNNRLVVDITKRVRILMQAKSSKTVFYDYHVQDTDTPDSVAARYYGDDYFFWLIHLVNDQVDPNYDWPMPPEVFDKYVLKKYNTYTAARSTILYYKKVPEVFYVSRTSLFDIITEAEYLAMTIGQRDAYEQAEITEHEILISPESYEAMDEGQDEYVPVYAYDWEFAENERRRNIRLLDLRYLDEVREEFKKEMR